MDFAEEAEVKISDLTTTSKRVNVRFRVGSKGEPRDTTSRDGSSHRVADVLVGDETGSILMSLWDDTINTVEVDGTYKLSNGYVTVFRNSMRLSVGKYGHLEASEPDIEAISEENALSDRVVERPQRSYGGGGGGGGGYRGGGGGGGGGYRGGGGGYGGGGGGGGDRKRTRRY